MSQGEGLSLPDRPDRLSTLFDLSLARPADWRVMAIVAVAGAAVDLAVRSGIIGAAGLIAVVVAAAGMLVSGRVGNPQARALVALSPLFGMWLLLRTSPWLIPLDVVAAGGLLVLGASFARSGSVFDLSLPQAMARAFSAAIHGVVTPAFAQPPLRALGRWLSGRRTTQTRAIARGLLLAVPVLVVLGLLLASADVVFAGFFRLNVNFDPAGGFRHAAMVVAGGWGMAGLLRVASAERTVGLAPLGRQISRTEAGVLLGSLLALFAAFAAAQLVVLAGGGRHVIETAGLTYAEYARSGFFQLVAVAVITLLILLSLRATADLGSHTLLLVLAECTAAFTLVIVVVAIRRMALYEHVFGLTMLRWYVKLFSLWIGAVFVALGLALTGVWRRRHWLPPAAAALGLALLLALNAANPEAYVVRHNVEFAERTHRFDPAYLAELSDDAVPALVAALPGLEPRARAAVVSRLCPRLPGRWTGWASFNLSRDRADNALADVCGRPGSAAPATG